MDPDVLLKLIDRIDAVRAELRQSQDLAVENRIELQSRISALREELTRHQSTAEALRRDLDRIEAGLESGRAWQSDVLLEMNRLATSLRGAGIEIHTHGGQATSIGGDNQVDGDQAIKGDVKK